MQNAALAAVGLGDTWHYGALDIEPAEFAGQLRDLANSGSYVGVNVTVPHKEAALAEADSTSAAARQIGAANTLVFGEDGSIHADNTDAPGLIAAVGAPVAGRRALVFGAGGAARAAVWALVEQGARVSIWARRLERARALAEELGAEVWDADPTRPVTIADFELLVQASAAGLADGLALPDLPLAVEELHAEQTVVDMVYGEHPTDLAEAVTRAGARLVDGLEILVRQGAISFTTWTGRQAPIETMRRSARSALPEG